MRAKKILLSNLALALVLISSSALADLPYNVCSDLTSCQSQAAAGDMKAEYNLGLIYDDGINVKADYTLAAQWYQKSATQGLSIAQYRLGLLYYNGNGVPQDKKMAVQLYEQAASQGSSYSQYQLGIMYQTGDGVPQDYQKAMSYYLQSAAGGDPDGSVGAGIMYKNGYGVSKDFKKAVSFYTQAVNAGDSDGAYDLGLLYYLGGPGVPQDLVKSYAWFAAANAMTPNDPDTMRLKGEVYNFLTPNEQPEAKTLAQQYVTQYGGSGN
ncbi:MAG: sel1 repeat family protein [Legionellales bacterium]|nr:sel1 repeat family protein [Legionellales bacterium]